MNCDDQLLKTDFLIDEWVPLMLRTGFSYGSNECFMPVMELMFLRHAYRLSLFLNVKDDTVASLLSRGGKSRDAVNITIHNGLYDGGA